MDEVRKFEIVESVGKGKVMIALENLQPGETIISREVPIMFIPQEYLERYTAEPTLQLVVGGYSIYNRFLSIADKTRFDSLFGPTTGNRADFYRAMVSRNKIANNNEDGSSSPFSPEQTETFVRVANTIGLNAYGSASSGYMIMDNITRMSHSCLPNCKVDVTSTGGSCRTILPVKKGEELTQAYSNDHRWKPTHFRRHRFLERKDFTCHCPRCDAEADDTREFDCHDPQCPGSHFTCQPINQKPLGFPGLQYTGVEYVEPHLLPCTECHRAAPLSYQQDMFALEKRLRSESDKLAEMCSVFRHTFNSKAAVQAWQRVEALKMPRHHSLTVELLKIRGDLSAILSLPLYKNSIPAFQQKVNPPITEVCARNYVGAIERRSKYPTDQEVKDIFDTCFAVRFCLSYSKSFALECCQKALRKHLILHGRASDIKKLSGVAADTARTARHHHRVHVLRRVSPARRPHAEQVRSLQAGGILQCGLSEGALAFAQEGVQEDSVNVRACGGYLGLQLTSTLCPIYNVIWLKNIA